MLFRAFFVSLLCLVVIVFSGMGSLAIGTPNLTASKLISTLLYGSDSYTNLVVYELRLPRLVVTVFVGATLGMAGTMVQSITRNPLGSPDLLGVSSGASCAIVTSMALATLSPVVLTFIGTLGGLAAGFIAFLIAWRSRLDPMYLTLSGLCVALFFNAATILLLILAKEDTNGIYFWLVGSLMDRTWEHVHLLTPFALVGLTLGYLFSKPLNLLMLDDVTSQSLGFPTQIWRVVLGVVAVVLTAATVSVAGPISFVGLVAPYLSRLGVVSKNDTGYIDHKILLPVSMLAGAALVCAADMLAKFQGTPVGILSVLLGGPFFIFLVKTQMSASDEGN